MKFMIYMDTKKNKYKNKLLLPFVMAGTFCLLCGCQNGNNAELSVMADENVEETESMNSGEVSDSTETGENSTEEVSDGEAQGELQSTESATEAGTENAEITDETVQSGKPEPVKVKGIYVSGPVAGIDRMDELITLVDETELNAMVIDIKNDEGRVTYKMETDKVLEIGAGVRYISDIEGLVQKCKEKNIYLIARIVAFKDPYLAEQCPELAVKKKTGEIFKDRSGLAWVNPYKKEVWDYLLEIAKEAAAVGFDEIQFDYIRFSTDLKSDVLDFGPEAEGKTKTEVITEFTRYACEELADSNVYVAADVYGTIIDNKVDMEIVGQNYVEMSSYLDYICPMVYPSHYANGVYGIKVPDAEPYRTVNAAMNAATKELSVLSEEEKAINRVWIQSFTANWVDGHISYGPQQIREQIRGAYDAGYDEWILWNASIKYQRDSLLTEEEAKAEQEAWDKEKQEAEKKVLEQAIAEAEAKVLEETKAESETEMPEASETAETMAEEPETTSAS